MSVDYSHPLDPLSVEEVNLICAFVREEVIEEKGYVLYSAENVARTKSQPFVKFITINIHEPKKEVVLNYNQGDKWDRQVSKKNQTKKRFVLKYAKKGISGSTICTSCRRSSKYFRRKSQIWSY